MKKYVFITIILVLFTASFALADECLPEGNYGFLEGKVVSSSRSYGAQRIKVHLNGKCEYKGKEWTQEIEIVTDPIDTYDFNPGETISFSGEIRGRHNYSSMRPVVVLGFWLDKWSEKVVEEKRKKFDTIAEKGDDNEINLLTDATRMSGADSDSSYIYNPPFEPPNKWFVWEGIVKRKFESGKYMLYSGDAFKENYFIAGNVKKIVGEMTKNSRVFVVGYFDELSEFEFDYHGKIVMTYSTLNNCIIFVQ